MKRALQWGLGAVVSVVVVLLLTRGVSLESLRQVVHGVDQLTLASLAAVCVLSSTVLSAALYRQTLKLCHGPVPFGPVLTATVGSAAFRALLPSSAGSLTRPVYLKRLCGVSLSAGVLATALVLWFKLLWLLLFVALGSMWLVHHDVRLGASAAAVLALGILGTLALPRCCAWTEEKTGKFKEKQIVMWLLRLAAAISRVGPRDHVLPVLLAGLAAGLELVVYGVLLTSLGGTPTVAQIVTFFPLCIMAGKFPFAILGIGPRDAAAVALLASAAPRTVLLTSTLLYPLLDQVAPALVGSVVVGAFLIRIVRPDGGTIESS